MRGQSHQTLQAELATLGHPTELNPFMVKFCLMYVSGQYRFATQCYRACLSPEEADLMSNKAVGSATDKLLSYPPVKNYLRALMAKLEEIGVATLAEVKMFMTDAIRTPINEIDGDSPLCQKKVVKEITTKKGDRIVTTTYESVNKMDAVKTLGNMSGWNAPLKLDVNHTGGVMLVPMAETDDWEQSARAGQEQLMQDAIDI